MMYLIAGVLLGAAIVILTLPWSRHDPADFSTAELGYAWRGPRGAVGGALRVLINARVVGRSRIHGMVQTDAKLPRGVDPFVRAVYAGVGRARGLSGFLARTDVHRELPAVAERAMVARLRVGRARRVIGTLVALAAPVIAVVAMGNETTTATTGIVVSIVTGLIAARLVALRGVTIRGARTLAAVPRRGYGARQGATGQGGGLNGSELPVGWLTAGALFGFGAPTSSFAVDTGSFGGDGGGGDSGGGGDGGDSGF